MSNFDLAKAVAQADDSSVQILPVSKVKDRLKELVDAAARTHEQITMPKGVGKALKRQLEGSQSARRGPYRVIHDIDDVANRIEILRFDHRADVHRNP